MQVILKQSEITAALAAYMVNVLGATGVTPETLNVVYKQGRSDKNGMTAELEIEAPAYEKQKHFVGTCATIESLSENPSATSLGNELKSGQTQLEATSASAAVAPVAAQVVDASEPAATVQDPEAATVSLTRDEQLTDPAYDGERRAEPREEEPAFNREERVAELNDEVAQALAEDEQAELAEAEAGVPLVDEVPANTAAPLFG